MFSPTWLLAFIVTSTTAMAFVVAMATFFRSRQGHAAHRVLLLGSVAGGLIATFWSLAGQRTVGPVAASLGTLLALSAQALFWWAVRAHGDYRPSAAFATAAPPVVLDRGPYAWVRHPFYCAYLLGFMSGAVFTENRRVWMVPLWLLVVYVFAARQEERIILASPLGDLYRDYRRRVGGFVPGIASGIASGPVDMAPPVAHAWRRGLRRATTKVFRVGGREARASAPVATETGND